MIIIIEDGYTYTVAEDNGKPFIACKVCEYKTNDWLEIQVRYCSVCKDFHDEMQSKYLSCLDGDLPALIKPGTMLPSNEEERLVWEKELLEIKRLKAEAKQRHQEGVGAIHKKYPWLKK